MTVNNSDIERLQQGNLRFQEQTPTAIDKKVKPAALAHGQKPFAIVLSCADSRVPPEILFDQDLGDLFVVRVAGNIARPTQIGSIEFALQEFGCSLIVVLGHTQCGGVIAALSDGDAELSAGLSAIVSAIKNNLSNSGEANSASSAASVQPLSQVDQAVQTNVRATVAQLITESSVIGQSLEKGECDVVGAVYDLSTGAVEFLS